MSDKAFLDTNILIYCYTSTEPQKQIKALEVTNIPAIIISTQVLKEWVNVLHKKFRLPWPSIQQAYLEVKQNFSIHTNTTATIERACFLAHRYQYSFYDSLIVAAAMESGCKHLYTEDLHDGQVIDGLKIVNPFATH